MSTTKERLRRNMIFVPGNLNNHILDAANDLGTDSVILDLEDLVPPDEKEAARKMVCETIISGLYQERGIEVVVRINHPDTEYFQADMEEIMKAKPDMIRIPKVESKEDVLYVDKIVANYEKVLGYEENSVYLMAAIESAKGVLNAYEIAESCPRLIGMALSSADYTADIHATRTKEGIELDWARGMLINSARAAGIFVMDTSFIFQDLEAFEAETRKAKIMGFDGKTAGTVWPGQTAVINKVYSPSKEEIEYAKKVIKMEKDFKNAGTGFISDGDMFFDKPIVERYRRMLRMAGETEEE